MVKKILISIFLIVGVAAFAYNAYSERPLLGGTAGTASSLLPQKIKGIVVQVNFYSSKSDAALIGISDQSKMGYCYINLDAKGEAILNMINAGAEVQVQSSLNRLVGGMPDYPDCGDVSIYPIMH